MPVFDKETGTYDKDQLFKLELFGECKQGEEQTALKGKIEADCSHRFMTSCLIGLTKENESFRNAFLHAASIIEQDTIEDIDETLNELKSLFGDVLESVKKEKI